MVTYTGPLLYERWRGTRDGRLQLFRWIKLRESGPVCDVCIKLYANSQSSFLKSLKAGQLIVLTNMVLKSVCTDSCNRSFKLESESKSSMFTAAEFGERHKISEVCFQFCEWKFVDIISVVQVKRLCAEYLERSITIVIIQTAINIQRSSGTIPNNGGNSNPRAKKIK